MAILPSYGDGGEVTVTDVATTDDSTQSYTPDSGGHAPEPPEVPPPPPEPEPDIVQPTGGEHTYDVDDSAESDVSLDYSPINDPRQTAEDTSGLAGGDNSQSLTEGFTEGVTTAGDTFVGAGETAFDFFTGQAGVDLVTDGMDNPFNIGIGGAYSNPFDLENTRENIQDAGETVTETVQTVTEVVTVGIPNIPIPTFPQLPIGGDGGDTNITVPGMKWVAVAILAAVAYFGYQESQTGN